MARSGDRGRGHGDAETLRSRLALIFGSVLLRLAYAGMGQTDQLLVAQAAAEHVLGGGNPYGVGYAVTIPPGAPYPYGPLGLVWWLPGWPVELVASGVLLWVLARQRAWLTFSLIAAFPPFVYLTPTGVNDYSPTLLIAFALVGMRVPTLGSRRFALPPR